jgi:hypothetical protein
LICDDFREAHMLQHKHGCVLIERRRAPRLRDPEGLLQVTVFQHHPLTGALIRDISAYGLGLDLRTAHPLEVGAILTVELFHPVQKCWYMKLLRVRHAKLQADGVWCVGGVFSSKLTGRELLGLFPQEAAE